MAIDQDVLVIGGGLAGAMAALGSAQTGATTRLVSASQSTLRQASGLIDLLGYTPDGEGPLADPFEVLGDLPANHPYSIAGLDSVAAGFSRFDEITGDAYLGGHTPANALLPTVAGTVKPTARYPDSMAGGLASDDRDVLLVGFERLPVLDAPLAGATLSELDLPYDVRGVTLEFPVAVDPDAKATRFARLLDRNTASGGPENLRRALAERIAVELEGESRVGFPPVLGLDNPAAVRGDIESILSMAAFELPAGPPSLPGIRLENVLFDALDETGVLVETGNPVVDYEAKDGKTVESVAVDRNGSEVPYAAGEYVLATGGLVGQGLESDREQVREPVFDCHVAQPDDRYDWFADDAFGDHPFARFGLTPDAELRPLTAAGDPEFDNLRAAGAVLGHYDYAAEKSASGVSIATGYRAGTLAGDAA